MFAKPALMVACLAALSTGVVRAADAPAPSAAPAAPAASAATVAALTALYQTTCAAALDPTDKNLDAMAALMAPDYVEYDPKGKETKRDEAIGNMKQQLKMLHSTDCKASLDSVTSPDANTAIVVNTARVSGDMQAPDGKHQFDVMAKSQDTWKLVNGNWIETVRKAIHFVLKIDGTVAQDQGQ